MELFTNGDYITTITGRSNVKKFTAMVILLLALSLSLSAFSIHPVSAVEDSWTSKAPLPLSSWGVVGANGKIYAIAGSGEYANVSYLNNAVFEYDPALDTWTIKKAMPIKRSGFALAVYQNKIYVIGGSNGTNQVYDPATGTWENRTSMPTPRTQLEANVVNSKIYVIGGQNEFHDPINLDLNQIYDTETDTWSFGTPIPNVVWQAAAGATTGEMAPKRIYVIGGLPDKSMIGTNMTQVYDPATDTWTIGESMPTARFTLHVAVLNDTLYVMGGLPFFNLSGVRCQENEQYTPVGYIPEFPSLTTIYIRADGSVEGTDKIQRDGNIYTLTGDISGEIKVQKNFTVIDGAGYTLQGSGSGTGVGIRWHGTVQNLQIINFEHGISAVINNTILGNYIADCGAGILIIGGSSNTIKNNTFVNNVNPISIAYGGGNHTITENSMINGTLITVWLSPHPIVDRNYWSDYNGTDADGDGIGDTPHFRIAGNETIYIDFHPLMEPVPVIPEFPSWSLLLIFLITSLMIILAKKKIGG